MKKKKEKWGNNYSENIGSCGQPYPCPPGKRNKRVKRVGRRNR